MRNPAHPHHPFEYPLTAPSNPMRVATSSRLYSPWPNVPQFFHLLTKNTFLLAEPLYVTIIHKILDDQTQNCQGCGDYPAVWIFQKRRVCHHEISLSIHQNFPLAQRWEYHNTKNDDFSLPFSTPFILILFLGISSRQIRFQVAVVQHPARTQLWQESGGWALKGTSHDRFPLICEGPKVNDWAFFGAQRYKTTFFQENTPTPYPLQSYLSSISTISPRLYFPEEFRRNYVYSVTFLSYPAELRYPMSPENRKVTKGKAKGMCSLPVLHMIYICIYYVGLP